MNYVLTWRRGQLPGEPPDNPACKERIGRQIPHLRNVDALVEVLSPVTEEASALWHNTSGELTVGLPRLLSACLVELRSRQEPDTGRETGQRDPTTSAPKPKAIRKQAGCPDFLPAHGLGARRNRSLLAG